MGRPPVADRAPGLRRLLLGSACGFLGGHMLNFGIVQFAQEALGRPALAGAGLFLSFGTPLLLGLHAGALCERRAARAVALWFQPAFLAGALLLTLGAVVGVGGGAAIALLMAAALAVGVGWSYVATARLTWLTRLLPAERVRGPSIVFNVLTTVGFGGAPLLLGLLRSAGGFAAAFAGAAALLAVAQGLFLAAPAVAGDPPAPTGASGSWLAVARAGVLRVAAHPPLARPLAVCAIVHVLLGPVQVLLPPLLAERFGLGVVGRGAFLAIMAPMLIAGGLLALRLRATARPERLLLGASLSGAAALAALAILARPAAGGTAFIVFGVAGGLAVALLAALLTARTGSGERGRVMSFYAVSTQFFPALGGLCSGLLLLTMAPSTALLTMSGTVALLLARFAPAMWRADGAGAIMNRAPGKGAAP